MRKEKKQEEMIPPETAKEHLDEVLEMIRLMSETGLAELDVETGGFKISLKKYSPMTTVSAIPMTVPQAIIQPAIHGNQGKSIAYGKDGSSAKSAVTPVENAYHKILSPMAGTFYQAPSPTSTPYVKEGDLITAGQPICIVEAMKMMNEIKADKPGKIVKMLVDNAQSVEKGTILFWVDTKI